MSRRLLNQFAVHHQQGLGCDDRDIATAIRHRRIRKVELLEQVVQVVADDWQINRTTGQVVGRRILRGVIEDIRAILQGNGLAAQTAVEIRGNRQEGIADFLRVQPAHRERVQ